MLRFGDHTFDPDTGELDGPRESLRLQPKPARLLEMLLAAGGELVEREQIRDALWPDTTVDFDAGLNTCVRQIRTALQETGGSADAIETLPKRGYRIAVPVGPPEEPAQQPAAGATATGAPGPAQWLPYAISFVLLTIVSGVVLWGEMLGYPGDMASLSPARQATAPQSDDPAGPAGGPSGDAGDPVPAPVRLAVLPFADPDVSEPGALNRELGEAFLVALVAAAPQDIVVVGPTTTASHAAAGATPAEIAAALDASFVLHGGHRASTGVFFVEVITSDGGHVFARRFEDFSATPATIAQEVVPAMSSAILEAIR